MRKQAITKPAYYEYSTDANNFAGVLFDVGPWYEDNDDSSKVNDMHWTDVSVADSWEPLECKIIDDHDSPTQVGDFVTVFNYGKIPMVSERAWLALEPLIGGNCEVLPIIHPFEGTYYLIHVMKTIDALNTGKSKIDRYKSGDCRIARIYKYVFYKDSIEGQHVFKLPILCGSGLIIDDEFRKVVEINELSGLKFEKLPM